MEEIEKPYSKLEWFTYIILLPSIFSIALFTIIATFAGFNVLEKAIELGQHVPGLSKVLPAPSSSQGEGIVSNESTPEIDQVLNNLHSAEEEIKKLQAEKSGLEDSVNAKNEEIKALQGQISQLEKSIADKKITNEEYNATIVELSKLYGGMSPGKAAPIIQNLTLKEAALIIDKMNNDQRAALLAKMDPIFAAQLTIALKEMNAVDQPEIAALQERVQILMDEVNKKTEGSTTKLTMEQLANTFNQMPVNQAAGIITEMSSSAAEFKLATKILANMSDANRSSLIAAMPTETAKRYTKALLN